MKARAMASEAELEKEIRKLEQDNRTLSAELAVGEKLLKKADAALYKLKQSNTKGKLAATIVTLTDRIQDLLEANNCDVERRREAEALVEYHIKYNSLLHGPLFKAYMKMEKKLKDANDELARSN